MFGSLVSYRISVPVAVEAVPLFVEDSLFFFRVFRLLDSNTHHSQAARRSSNSYLGWITIDLCMCKLPVPFICEQ